MTKIVDTVKTTPLLNASFASMLTGVPVVIEKWRVVYNTLRPHSALGYEPPAPTTFASLQALAVCRREQTALTNSFSTYFRRPTENIPIFGHSMTRALDRLKAGLEDFGFSEFLATKTFVRLAASAPRLEGLCANAMP